APVGARAAVAQRIAYGHGNRVGLFAAGAARAPYAKRAGTVDGLTRAKLRHYLPRQSVERTGMTEETSIRINQTVEQGWQAGWILVGAAKTFEQRRRRSQTLGLDIIGEVRGQSAVGAIKNDSGLALDQQAQLREFVFQDS